jgi:hypothetical protein
LKTKRDAFTGQSKERPINLETQKGNKIMSCILYSKGAYNQLEKNSQLVREIFAPLSVSEFLFELNADAFSVRYDNASEDVDGARFDLDGDSEFDLKDWNDPIQLVHLFGRIRYQCSDIYDKGEEATNPDHVSRYQVLEAAIAELEHRATDPRYKVEQFRKAELAREELAAQKAIDKERIVAELEAQYPWAKAGKPSFNLKKELTLAFPGIKFSVRSDAGSLDITWTDGPTTDEVDKIAGKYEAGRFDGMTNSYSRDTSAYGSAVSEVLGRARYVSSRRNFSQRFLRDAVIEVCFKYGHEELPLVKTYNDGSAWIEGGNVPYCSGAMHYDTLSQKIIQHAHTINA